jgi:SAM-dependent methyltransferase
MWHTRHLRRDGVPWHGQGRLLDFGCGGGAYLELMGLQGWKVLGLDQCPSIIERIRAELDLPALVGSLPHPEVRPGSFDVVTMWHSLEHVHQPLAILRAAWDALVPGGKLVVGVPNMGSPPCRWFGPAWIGWDLPRHLTHFTPESLSQVVEAIGFHVERVHLPANPFWLRISAESASRQATCSRWVRCLKNHFLSRQVATYLDWRRQSDELILTASKPAAEGASPHFREKRLP